MTNARRLVTGTDWIIALPTLVQGQLSLVLVLSSLNYLADATCW
jgi:hypothetical protein